MSDKREIQLSLFKHFELGSSFIKVAGGIQETPQDPNKRLAIIKAADNITHFVRGFIMQFFLEGYDHQLLSFRGSNVIELQAFFQGKANFSSRPQKMLSLVDEYPGIEKSVVAGEYTNTFNALKTLFCDFLPRLFDAFESDCSRSRLENCKAVIKKLDEAKETIRSICSADPVERSASATTETGNASSGTQIFQFCLL